LRHEIAPRRSPVRVRLAPSPFATHYSLEPLKVLGLVLTATREDVELAVLRSAKRPKNARAASPCTSSGAHHSCRKLAPKGPLSPSRRSRSLQVLISQECRFEPSRPISIGREALEFESIPKSPTSFVCLGRPLFRGGSQPIYAPAIELDRVVSDTSTALDVIRMNAFTTVPSSTSRSDLPAYARRARSPFPSRPQDVQSP
jgi:hypothetical protein